MVATETREADVSELYRLEGVREVRVACAVSSDGKLICPQCEREIPTWAQVRLAKPLKFEDDLNDIFRCNLPHPDGRTNALGQPKPCGFIFSPRHSAFVLTR